MAKQVAQRPDAAYTPSLMHEMKGKAETTEEANRELKLQVEQLQKKLDESETREAYLSERLDGLEYEYNQVTSGKDSDKKKLSAANEELRLLKIIHDEQKEDYEIEISRLKREIKERYDEQEEREKKWKSRESDWLLKNADLEGDYRSVHNELLEYKNKTSSSSGSINKEAATQSCHRKAKTGVERVISEKESATAKAVKYKSSKDDDIHSSSASSLADLHAPAGSKSENVIMRK